jgi:hypothetical protein
MCFLSSDMKMCCHVMTFAVCSLSMEATGGRYSGFQNGTVGHIYSSFELGLILYIYSLKQSNEAESRARRVPLANVVEAYLNLA